MALSPMHHTDGTPIAEKEAIWQTVVWDDPVNLMSYVSYVFQKHFGFTAEHAEILMMQVHTTGSSVVAEGSRSQMEMHVEAMHEYRPLGDASTCPGYR